MLFFLGSSAWAPDIELCCLQRPASIYHFGSYLPNLFNLLIYFCLCNWAKLSKFIYIHLAKTPDIWKLMPLKKNVLNRLYGTCKQSEHQSQRVQVDAVLVTCPCWQVDGDSHMLWMCMCCLRQAPQGVMIKCMQCYLLYSKKSTSIFIPLH